MPGPHLRRRHEARRPSRSARRRAVGVAAGAALLLVAALAAGCAGVERRLSEGLLHPRAEVHATPADWGLPHEDVVIATGPGTDLRGWFVPSAASGGATVILFHGDMSTIADYEPYIRFLHDGGLSVFIYDYPGFGESRGEALIHAIEESIEPVVEHVKGRPDVDPSRIGLLGLSLGSILALRAASEHPDVAAVVVEDCISPDDRVALALDRQDLGALERWFVTAYLDVFVLPWGIEPTDAVADYEGPVLVIQGERDRRITVDTSVEVFRIAPGPASLWVVPGTGHVPGPLRTYREEYAGAIVGFLRAALAGEHRPLVVTWESTGPGSGYRTSVVVERAGASGRQPVEVALRSEGGDWSFVRTWLVDGTCILEWRSPGRITAVAAHVYDLAIPEGEGWRPR